MEKMKSLWKKAIVIGIITLFLLTSIVTAGRINFGNADINQSEKSLFRYIFWDIVGNDSVLHFDSDEYNTTRLEINGTSGNVTVYKNFSVNGNISLEFGDLVSEQNPDGYNAIRLKGTVSDVDVVLGASGYFSIWNAAENNVFDVDDSGNTVIQGYLDMNSNQINELTDPTLNQDAATKKYVDDLTDASLLDNSMADTLHRHSELSASDGTPDRALVVDATGNVGIGTASPTSKLHVYSTTEVTNIPMVNFTNLDPNAGDSDALLVRGGANNAGSDTFKVQDYSGNTDFVVLGDGNVGIGTDSPDSIFHIKANVPGGVGSASAGQIIIQNPADDNTSNAIITGYESDGSGNPDQQLWYLGSSSTGNEDIIFLNRRDAKLTLGTSGTSRITILGNGNVGIGTSSPNAKLQVVGVTNSTGGFATDEGVGWSGTYTVDEGVVTVRYGIIIDVDWD